jgi:hypothetical protein
VNKKLEIVNRKTGHTKRQSTDYHGYKYVTCNNIDNRQIKVFVHKIIALAFINNGYYEVINHKNGIRDDNRVCNLEFTTNSENIKHAYRTGLAFRKEVVFEVVLHDGTFAVGTMKELSKRLGIPRGTLYDNYYYAKNSRKIKSIAIS